MIALNNTLFQRLRWYKRYYLFTAETDVIDRYYIETKDGCVKRVIRAAKTRPNDEVVFDYWRERIVKRPMVYVQHSNKRVLQVTQDKYVVFFTEQHFINDWYINDQRVYFDCGYVVVPNVAYLLNISTNTLEDM